MKSVLVKEDGFAFTATVIMVSVILGFSAFYLSNSVSLNISEVADDYSTSQSYWSALSGIEYAIQTAWDNEEVVGAIGTFSFYNSTVTVEISNEDRFGTPLLGDTVRVISTGIHGQTKRILEITAEELYYTAQAKGIWPDESTIEMAVTDIQTLKDNLVLNDTIYIGANVELEGTPAIGDTQYGNPTLIRVAPGKTVTGYNPWVEHDSVQSIPVLDFSNEDSLIDIANSIKANTQTYPTGNKKFGDLTIDLDTLNFNPYQDGTLFVKGKVSLKGTTVIGGSFSIPGILVATGDISAEGSGDTETTVADNIIFISKSQVKLLQATQFGTKVLGEIVNELYGRIEILIEENATAFAQCYSRGDFNLNGKLYGLIYTTSQLKWTQATGYLEGAVFANRIQGHVLSEGRMNLTHEFPDWYLNPEPSSYRFATIQGTLREI